MSSHTSSTAPTPSPILTYVDTVVATYDAENTEAVYENIEARNVIETNTLIVSSAIISQLKLGGYDFPTGTPGSDDYLAFNGTAFEYRNFNAAGVTINGIGDLILPSTKNNGTILHMANSASQITADSASEYTIIDSKPTIQSSELNLSDRLIVSVDKPGYTNPILHKLPLSTLFTYIENEVNDLAKIKNLNSNTFVDALSSEVQVSIDDGGVLSRVSTFANTGLTLHGDLYFNSDTDIGANGSIGLIANGFTFRRFDDNLDFDIDGTHNFIVRNDLLQLGANLTVANNSFLDLLANSSITTSTNSHITLDQDLTITSDLNVNSVTADTLSATTLVSSVDFNATNNVDAVNINGAILNGANIIAAIDINAGNDIFAANAVFSGTPPVVLSSALYKENINTLDSGLSYIMNMNPVKYDRKNNSSFKNELGFIAEEMENILPNIVKSGHGVKGIQYNQIIPVIVAAMQEQQRKIEELENKIK